MPRALESLEKAGSPPSVAYDRVCLTNRGVPPSKASSSSMFSVLTPCESVWLTSEWTFRALSRRPSSICLKRQIVQQVTALIITVTY